MLDAVVDYLPSPFDVPPVIGLIPGSDKEEERKPSDPDGPFCALVFKIMTDPYVGVFTFIRVYSGELKSGSYVYNANTGTKERVSRLVKMHANKREEIDSVECRRYCCRRWYKRCNDGAHVMCKKGIYCF